MKNEYDDSIKNLLLDYADYVEAFAKQVYSKELWKEQTGCELDEYFGYVSCCEDRLYSFKTWFEHTQAKTYPVGLHWDEYSNHKLPLLGFHP
jgi:hypothetical protein